MVSSKELEAQKQPGTWLGTWLISAAQYVCHCPGGLCFPSGGRANEAAWGGQAIHQEKCVQHAQSYGAFAPASQIPAIGTDQNFPRRLQEDDNMREALRFSSAMLSELRTSQLSPQKYYELYMLVFDQLVNLEVGP